MPSVNGSISHINEKSQPLIIKEALKKTVKTVGIIFTLFFSSGLQPWTLKPDSRPDHVERDDIDFLLDMAQFHEVSLEPSQEN
jgi:hypothetical protein